MSKRKVVSKKIEEAASDWHARADQLRKQLESAWSESEHTLESLWHQSAVATLHWVGSNRARVDAFRKSVKGTPVERAVNAALKAIRTEGRASKPRASGSRKPAVKRKATVKRKKVSR